jgi:hypothetical protein
VQLAGRVAHRRAEQHGRPGGEKPGEAAAGPLLLRPVRLVVAVPASFSARRSPSAPARTAPWMKDIADALESARQELVDSAAGLVDGGIRIGGAAGIGVGDGDPSKARAADHVRLFCGRQLLIK